ncbi:AMP-binding protein [Vallitalea guaymasensis]|uniref:AMP-binding protein n=1 Tax=Vallitalea guaymasensis TaxID=1185412 RepID=UPI0023529209|nr:AMP-binding protein [Vallitalea guaymasensis]
MNDLFKLEYVLQAMKENDRNYVEYYNGSTYFKKVFSDMYVDVMKVSLCLKNKGVQKGDRVGIIGMNSYEYMILDLAVITNGSVSVPFPEKDFKGKIQTLSKEYNLKLFFADEKYVNDSEEIINLENLLLDAEKEDYSDLEMNEIEDEDNFTIIFTSGTTGVPKGIEVRSKCVQEWMEHLVDSYDLTEDDKIIDFLTLSISNARLFVYASVLVHFNLVLTNTNELLRVLALSKPTIMQGVPYLFETFYRTFMSMTQQTFKKRFNYRLYHVLDKILPSSMLRGLHEKVFKSLKDLFGQNMRILVTGSAHTDENLLKFYEKADLRVYEVYGINEVGLVSMNNPKAYRIGSVGKPFKTKTIKISDNNEILIKSDFSWGTGYINDENNSKKTFREDGYVATGDLGHVDEDGYLYVEGRLKEVLILSNGDKIHPRIIEDDLKQTNLIKQAVAIGNQKPFISCIIVLEDANTPVNKINDAINEINKRYSDNFKIKEFIIADSPFTVENGLMNSTLKINRNAVYEAYKSKIEKLYT